MIPVDLAIECRTDSISSDAAQYPRFKTVIFLFVYSISPSII